MPRAMSDAERRKIIEYDKEGWGYRQIGSVVGRPPDTIYRFLRGYKAGKSPLAGKSPGRRPKLTPADMQRICRFAADNPSTPIREIAAAELVSVSLIRNVLWRGKLYILSTAAPGEPPRCGADDLDGADGADHADGADGADHADGADGADDRSSCHTDDEAPRARVGRGGVATELAEDVDRADAAEAPARVPAAAASSAGTACPICPALPRASPAPTRESPPLYQRHRRCRPGLGAADRDPCATRSLAPSGEPYYEEEGVFRPPVWVTR